MSTRRITIGVPEEIAARTEKAADGVPMSRRLTDRTTELDGLWREFVREVAPTAADMRRAKALRAKLMRSAKQGRAACSVTRV